MKLKRRVSLPPQMLGLSTSSQDCPDLWELDTGDFVAIGIDATEELRDQLPPDVRIGPDERAVLIPRKLLVSARNRIPRK